MTNVNQESKDNKLYIVRPTWCGTYRRRSLCAMFPANMIQVTVITENIHQNCLQQMGMTSSTVFLDPNLSV